METDLQHASDATMTARAPLTFVCGALRSGTTLLRLMLDEHSVLSNPGEMDFLFEFDPDAPPMAEAARYRRHLRRSRIFLKYDLKIDEGLDCPALVHSFVEQLRQPGKILTINIHRHFDRALRIFPDARLLHILRDPRDVARSSIGMGWAGHVYFGVDHWIASETDMERAMAMAAPGQIRTIRNEALILRTEETLAEICEFLGVDYEAGMLGYAEKSTYEAPDPSLVEQWRRKLSPREIGMVEAKAARLMEARGYAFSGAPRELPVGFELFRLRQKNRFDRMREDARRYGVGLFLADIISRRLPIAPVRDFVVARRNVKSLKYIK